MKVCTKCCESKPSDSYWPQGSRRCISKCKVCLSKQSLTVRRNKAAVTSKLSDNAPRTCCKCKQAKVASDFHQNPTEPGGRHRQCKPCADRAVHDATEKTARMQADGKDMLCRSCDTIKPATAFRRGRAQCCACVNAWVKAKRRDPREFRRPPADVDALRIRIADPCFFDFRNEGQGRGAESTGGGNQAGEGKEVVSHNGFDWMLHQFPHGTFGEQFPALDVLGQPRQMAHRSHHTMFSF